MTIKEKKRQQRIFTSIISEMREETKGSTGAEEDEGPPIEINKELHRSTSPIIGYITITLWFFVCIGAVIVFSLLMGG
jgi:hypothetical protein